MATAPGHRVEPSSGMGPRKTMIIMVTVVGCVAILWPKVFYPMMVGNGQSKNVIKDHRGAGCCGVVLDQETFANASINFGSQQPNQQRKQQDQQPNLFRKWSHVPFVEIHSIRQERPPHLRPEAMHPAMRERGRAIPQAGSIHGGDRPQTPPRIVEGRPGPIPGMRPPMGAGSHQATKSANSMGFIMPLYTIGIVSFFIYTIMKLIFKKSPATPYAEVKPDPAFRNEVFTTEPYIKRPDDGTTKLGQSATNGELVAPATDGAVAAAVEPQHASSVQAELTIDYEQLSKQQKEASQAPDQASAESVVEQSEVRARMAEDSGDEQPAHDPTTEKVVDGIVVKKVVSFEECSAGPALEQPVVESEVTEVVERTVVSEEEQVGPVQQEVPTDSIVEEFILEHRAPTQNAPMSRVENELLEAMVESTAEVPAESVEEEIIEKQQASVQNTRMFLDENEQVDKVEENITVESVIEEVIQEQSIPTPSAPLVSATDAPADIVEEVIAEISVEAEIEEVTLEQQLSTPTAETVPVSDEPGTKVEEAIPVEAIIEEVIQEQQLSNPTAESTIDTEKVGTKPDEPIAEIPVENVIVEVIEAPVVSEDKIEEPVAEIHEQTVVEEVILEQQAETTTAAVDSEDKIEEPVAEVHEKTAVEEVILEQQISTTTAAVDSEDKVDGPVAEVHEKIVVEEVILEQQMSTTTAAVDSEDKVDGPVAEIQKEAIIEEVTQTSIHGPEVTPVVKEVVEIVEESVSSVESEVSQEPELVQFTEPEQSSNVELAQAEPESATEVPQESTPVQQVIETFEIVEVIEAQVSKDEAAVDGQSVEAVLNEISEPVQVVENPNEEIESNRLAPEEVNQSGSTNAPAVEEREDEQSVALEAIPKENLTNEKQTTSEDVQQAVGEPVKEGHGLDDVTERDANQQVKITTVLDAETSSVVCDVAKNIAITAERLVQEVLDQAEEFVAQEQDQSPELPAYDPATQKLVDGVVIERFAREAAVTAVEVQQVEVTKEEEEEEKASQQESVVEVESARGVQVGPGEDDGAEVDEISEDTSLSVASVIENQQPAESVQEPVEETVPEALITTEVMTTSNSSEPVFVEEDQRPMVEAETVVEELEPAAGNQSGAAAANDTDQGDKGVLIEEVHDEGAIVDQAEGKVIEEHIVPITIESASASDAMTITEVTAGDEGTVESPRISKTVSNLPSPLVTAVPMMGAIHEQAELAEQPDEGRPVPMPSPETLEQVSKEALVERTLSEAAAVVNEIESIVDHIITEKLIQSGASEESDSKATALEGAGSAPPRLAASAALVVEAIESKASGVQGMTVPSSDSATQGTNGLPITSSTTNRVESMMGATNTPLPASDPLPVVASSATVPSSSDAFPAPVLTTASIPSASPAPPHDAPPSAPNAGSETHTSTNLHTADPAGADGASAAFGATSEESEGSRTTVVTERTVTTTTTVTSRHIGQVPTGGVSSSVTNPKFLTLNLANYSTSDSSGNNSKSSASSSPIANRHSQAPLAGSNSILLAGPGDGTDQLMELELLRKKLDETERAMTKIIANMGSIPKGQESNVTADEAEPAPEETATESTTTGDEPAKVTNGHAIQPADAAGSEQAEKRTSDGESSSSAGGTPEKRAKKRDTSMERGTVKVMAMEMTAQRENGKRLSRPTTPLLPMGHPEGASATVEEKETRSIMLDGRLPHDSKILVAESETAVEKMEPENSEEEDDAPVILSGKMTLSLINMDFIEKDATGTVAVGEIVTELHKPQEEITTAPVKNGD
uniref:Resistance to inhibitors of cholinesterase protein 3 N-terminal domain-containing protein n=1 Tax=Anopheles atroparvus TaxID=41427 RepID=A0AAG5D9Z5_ANOAO